MVTDMYHPIAMFKGYYAQQVLTGLEAITLEALTPAANAIAHAVVQPRNMIYIFGNGGSYAIGKHFALSLKERFRGTKKSVRIRHGIDMLESQAHAVGSDYNSIFSEILEEEQATAEDLVVLLSGSGDSDNVVNAATYCIEHCIPHVSFSGFDGGKIAKISRMPYIAQIHDQQMCEDVIQALLHQVVEQAFQVCQNSNPAKFKEYRTTYLKQIEQALTRISPACLENISRDIKNAFVTGHNVFLIAPEGDGPGISAEHTAHNLNWDAVYQVENPPKRYIFSTPTHCDYSGIGNDRIADGIVSMQQLEKARRGDVLLLFAYDSNSMCVKNTRKYAKDKGLTIYTLCGKGQGEICYRTNDPLVSADVMQMTGHMIGRIVRNMLKGSLDYDCLITEDLAQRRLIAERIEGL